MISAVVSLASNKPDAVRVPDPDIVSPGFLGFMTVFLLAVVTVLLIRSMTKHMRTVKFNADQLEREQPKDSGVQAPGQS
ncbi:hypothetical protein [Kineosporia babensis]|uniref:Uncharacterized protein n=1 Tax=Kineosporia babensis TaxID=499548 RepID=A0A9X1NHV4_9ACTN|nr:hypothetical protein [Kineosporia babensis]MCD5315292.1 hypothetical protein [Kineosporia babensis]